MSKKMTKNKLNIYILIYALVIFAIFIMTIGYAYFSRLININGELIIPHWGKLMITNVTLTSSSNVDSNYNPVWTEDSIDFNTYFTNEDSNEDCFATYQVTFSNTGSLDYALENFNFESINIVSSIEDDPAEISVETSGLVTPGYIFAPGETSTATVTIRIVMLKRGQLIQ